MLWSSWEERNSQINSKNVIKLSRFLYFYQNRDVNKSKLVAHYLLHINCTTESPQLKTVRCCMSSQVSSVASCAVCSQHHWRNLLGKALDVMSGNVWPVTSKCVWFRLFRNGPFFCKTNTTNILPDTARLKNELL